MSLIGKFFCHFGKEYMHSGEIVEQADAATVLVRLDGCNCGKKPPSMIAIPVAAIVTKVGKDGSFDVEWELFASRAELDAWLKWLDEPHDHDDDGEEPGAGAALN